MRRKRTFATATVAVLMVAGGGLASADVTDRGPSAPSAAGSAAGSAAEPAAGSAARAAAQAIPRSLPHVASGHRPGPDILYAPPARAPQLQNRPGSGWRARPLLVSGAAAYVRGEYLYQGYLYDDHGGAGAVDSSDPLLSNFLFAAKTGTLTYPTDKAFVNNAADLVEFRVRPTQRSTALRITLNSLVKPDRTAFTVAIGSSPAAVNWPDSAGVSSPAALFLTVHGSSAELVRAATGKAVTPMPTVTVDIHRRQYDVRIPHAAWNPRSSTVRFATGVGLWDVAGGHYLVPAATASATTPGGASPSGEALFDLAFRFHEPAPDWSRMGLTATLPDAAVMEQADQHCFWRDCAQGAALRLGDVSAFHADIDFGTLDRRVTDERGVPRTGSVDRIFASHFSFGQGVDAAGACGRFPVTCHGMFPGNLQPYNIYVPAKPRPRSGWGMTIQLHASGGNYNEYMGSRNQMEFGNRGSGSVVLTTLSRDPDGDYTDAAEADIFEAWADAARHYRLDPARTAITGYSMGGGGTYKMLERWPDLFARGFAAAAVPYDTGLQGQWITSMRNVPLMTWISYGDEGSPVLYQQEQIAALEAHGMQFTFVQFPEGDHVTLATNDEYGPAAAWLGDARRPSDPPRVTFAVDPANDFSGDGLVADHAYWLSGMTVRSLKAAPPPDAVGTAAGQVASATDPGSVAAGPAGLVDARSEGVGLADPLVNAPGQPPTPGVLMGGYHGPMPYLETEQSWAAPRRIGAADRLVITATNLSNITVDLRRAHLTCGATLDVQTDGPLTLWFPQCEQSVTFGAGHTTRRLTPA